ncbi:MAG: SCP2 sterol-binding domain-containing protein [Pseudomonadales bacterium]
MALPALKAHLQRHFHPPAAAAFDAVFRLAIEDEYLTFSVRQGALEFDVAEDTRPDATFIFQDVDTAWALLSGQADAFDAFMQGRFRADGYLMWAFALMAMFQSSSLPENPVE